MLAKLKGHDVRDDHQTFVKEFADIWAQGKWFVKDCDKYEAGLIKQEKLVSAALAREKQHTVVQLSGTVRRPQVPGEPPRSPLPSNVAGNQILKPRAQTYRRRIDTVSQSQIQPTHTGIASNHPQGPQGTMGTFGSQKMFLGEAIHEGSQDLADGNTVVHECRSHQEELAKLNIRLGLPGIHNKVSRHVRWSSEQTRDAFFEMVAEIFPDQAVQHLKVRRWRGVDITVYPTGLQGEWEIVRDDWLERSRQSSNKEPSATVHLAIS